MKVCMVYPFEFPALRRWEGSRSRLFSLCDCLVERGVEVHLIGRRDPQHPAATFRGVGLHQFREFGDSAAGRAAFSLMMGDGVRRLNKEHSFDVVHVHLPVAAASVAAWKRAIRSKTLFDTHDWFKLHDELFFNVPFIPPSLSGLVDRAERRLARVHDGVAVTTPLLSGAAGAGGRAFVVPNIVDTQHFRPAPSGVRAKWFGGGPVVVFLGFVSAHQGVFELIAAMKRVSEEVRDVNLLIVGGGLVERARAHASSLGVSGMVRFTGPARVPYEEIPDLVNAADVAVSPLQRLPRYQEYAQPLKVLEYLACAKPTVVTPLKEQTRLVSASGGGLVASGFGSEEIAEALISALRGGYGGDGESGRRYVEANHAPGVVADRLMAAYGALLKCG